MGVAISESDCDFLDYIDALERQWRENLYISLPKTETGWLEIFPEAREIIPVKIGEWKMVAAAARLKVRDALQTIETVPEEDRWFWRAVYKFTSQDVVELAIANRRVKRLQWLLPNNQKQKSMWWDVLARARGQDITSVANSYGLRLRKAGKTFHALCPFHNEHTPSFHIYPPSRFVCFGCGLKGDVIAFVQKIAACSFKEAVYKLQHI